MSATATSSENRPKLLQLLQTWPITTSLVESLPLTELLRLARSNSEIRAALHGFGGEGISAFRDLHVGQHQTQQWKALKRKARWECSSRIHTGKGSWEVSYCRLCSDIVCEACIVKSSIGKTENTFPNRCRYLCTQCWANEVPPRSRKIDAKTQEKRCLYNFAPGDGEFCVCSSKDGWICLECKEAQNREAKEDGSRICVGEGCDRLLEDDKDRRRICLWCDRPMLRGRASMQSRAAFDQHLIDVRISSLQEQRLHPRDRSSNGDEAESSEAPSRFINNLCVVDYRQLGVLPPTTDYAVSSLRGSWKYNRNFLLQFRPLLQSTTTLSRVANERMGVPVNPISSSNEVDEIDESDNSSEAGSSQTAARFLRSPEPRRVTMLSELPYVDGDYGMPDSSDDDQSQPGSDDLNRYHVNNLPAGPAYPLIGPPRSSTRNRDISGVRITSDPSDEPPAYDDIDDHLLVEAS